MRFRSVSGLAVFLSALTCVALCGCKKESTATAPPAPTPVADPAPPVEPPPPPPYKFPDKLPVHATLTFVKAENGAATYKATFDTKFEFDPARAQLAFDINTVGWTYHGRIVVTNKNDDADAGFEAHPQDYDQPPTDEKFNPPAEHQLLQPKEYQWVKDGGITLLIRNEEGASSAATAAPKILSVDLVEP